MNLFPKDEPQARAMMEKVAGAAKCGSFEYFNHTSNSWKYTCQQGERDFTLITASSKETLDELSGKLRADGFACITKSTYIVVAPKDTGGLKIPGGYSSPEWLTPFE